MSKLWSEGVWFISGGLWAREKILKAVFDDSSAETETVGAVLMELSLNPLVRVNLF